MLENLKLGPAYDGFLFLAESIRNPPALRPHRHVELELNLVVNGTISYVVDGTRYSFSKGALLWLYPRQEHQLVDRTPDAAYYVAVFKPDLMERACRGAFYRGLKRQNSPGPGVIHCELTPQDFDTLRREMQAIVDDGLDADLLNREAGFGVSEDFSFRHNDPDWLNAGLRHILLSGWRLQQRPQGKSRAFPLHAAVRQALRLLEEDPASATLGTLAARCGVSESFLSRAFSRELGVSFSRYRNSVRLSRFWEAYRAGSSETLLDAVLTAGFGSYAQFFRVFTEAYGIGPREALKRSEGRPKVAGR